MQMQGENEKSSQKRPDLAMNQKAVMLLGDSDYMCQPPEHDFNFNELN